MAFEITVEGSWVVMRLWCRTDIKTLTQVLTRPIQHRQDAEAYADYMRKQYPKSDIFLVFIPQGQSYP